MRKALNVVVPIIAVLVVVALLLGLRSSLKDEGLRRKDVNVAYPVHLDPFQPLLNKYDAADAVKVQQAYGATDLAGRAKARSDIGISATRSLAFYTRQIAKYNEQHRAVVELNPDAIDEAKQFDADGREYTPERPFRGAFVLVSGNIAVKGMRNDAGSKLLGDQKAKEDSDIVARLKDRGAIILGRTNMTELGGMVAKEMPNGFSEVGGQTKDSRDPEMRDPQGSAAGAAVAQSLNFADFVVAADTTGDTLAPGAVAGSFAARLPGCSTKGMLHIDKRLDAIGVLGRSINDVDTAARELCKSDTDYQPKSRHRVIGVNLDKDFIEGLQENNVAVEEPSPKLQRLLDELAKIDPHGVARAGFLDQHDVDALRQHYRDYPYGHDGLSGAPSGTDGTIDKAKQIMSDITSELDAAHAEGVISQGDGSTSAVLGGGPRMTIPALPYHQDTNWDVDATKAWTVDVYSKDKLPEMLLLARHVDGARWGPQHK